MITRFLFDNLDIRGAVVQLGETWRQILAGRDYCPATTRLLGEMCAVTSVIAGNLKTPVA